MGAKSIDWVRFNGRLVELHYPNKECLRILKTLESAPPASWPVKFYDVLVLCLPDLTETEVRSFTVDQVLALQQRMMSAVWARVPPPSSRFIPPTR